MQAKHGGTKKNEDKNRLKTVARKTNHINYVVYKENNEAFNFTTNFCLTPRDAQLL
jgi:hypothetical protein